MPRLVASTVHPGVLARLAGQFPVLRGSVFLLALSFEKQEEQREVMARGQKWQFWIPAAESKLFNPYGATIP
jgi:hypothetical protein